MYSIATVFILGCASGMVCSACGLILGARLRHLLLRGAAEPPATALACGDCVNYVASATPGRGVCTATAPAAMDVHASDGVHTADHYGVPCPYYRHR